MAGYGESAKNGGCRKRLVSANIRQKKSSKSGFDSLHPLHYFPYFLGFSDFGAKIVTK